MKPHLDFHWLTAGVASYSLYLMFGRKKKPESDDEGSEADDKFDEVRVL